MNSWIATRKKLPPARGKYLVLRFGNTSPNAKFFDPVNGWSTTVPVLYWQPLPDYPVGYLAGDDEESQYYEDMLERARKSAGSED